MDLIQAIEQREPFVTISLDHLNDTLSQLEREHQFQMLLDIIAVDRGNGQFELIYLLLSMEYHYRLGVRCLISKTDVMASVADIWPNAGRLENEVWDLMGLRFDSELSRVLCPDEFNGHSLLKDFTFGKFKEPKYVLAEARENDIILTPSSLAMEGGLQLSMHLEGEQIKECSLETGFLHRGIEKLCESRNYNQILPLVERLNHNSAAMNAIAWVKAVEEHAAIEISDRTKVLRMIFFELSRVIDHLLVIKKLAQVIHASDIYKLTVNSIDIVSTLFSHYSPEGLTSNVVRVGGMARDIPIGWISKCYEQTRFVKKKILKIHKKMTSSRIWMERTRVCSLSPIDAIGSGCTGPTLRACGINYDTRKVSPFYFYRDLEFEVPLGLHGDSYDRCLIRVEECLQSIFMVGQLLDNVPIGETAGLMEQNIDKDFVMKKGESYSFVEAANGELGFYLLTEGGSNPYRLKIRTPSLPLVQIFPQVGIDSNLSDALLGLKSLNIVPGELDR